MTALFTAAAQLKRPLNKYSSECGVRYRQQGRERKGSEVENEWRQNQSLAPTVTGHRGSIVEGSFFFTKTFSSFQFHSF